MSGSDSDDGSTPQSAQVEDVLVISLGVPSECPGMLPEHKVHTVTHLQCVCVHACHCVVVLCMSVCVNMFVCI